MIQMSEEAHTFFLEKVEKADSLEAVVNTLEIRVGQMQDSLEHEQKNFVKMLIASDKIRSELEQTRFALNLEVQDLERQLRLLKVSRRQRKAMLRKYYPKLTRDQRFTILFMLPPVIAVGLIVGLTN